MIAEPESEPARPSGMDELEQATWQLIEAMAAVLKALDAREPGTAKALLDKMAADTPSGGERRADW
jgi:hypothetical protein